MTGALEALLLLAAVGRRAGLRFSVRRFWMVTAGHQTFQRGTEVYLGWIGVVSFFLCIAVGLAGAGERPEKAARPARGDVSSRAQVAAGLRRSVQARRQPARLELSWHGLLRLKPSLLAILVSLIAHNQAFPSVPREPGPEVPTRPVGDPDTDLSHPLPV